MKAISILLFSVVCALGQDSSLVEKIPFSVTSKSELKGDVLLGDKFKINIQNDQRSLIITDQSGAELFSHEGGSVWDAVSEKNKCVLLIRKKHGKMGYDFLGLLVLEIIGEKIQCKMLGDGYLPCGDKKGMWVTDIVKFKKDNELEVRSTVFRLDNIGSGKQPEEYEKWSAVVKLNDTDTSQKAGNNGNQRQ